VRRTLTLVLAVPLVLGLTAAVPTASAPGGDPSAVGVSVVAVRSPGAREDTASATPPVALATLPAVEPPRGLPTAVAEASAAEAEGTVDERGESHAGSPRTAGRPDGRPEAAVERDRTVEATFLVAAVPSSGAVAGSGRRWRYTVEVEPGLGIDPDLLAAEVRAALTDDRSWGRTRTLEQVSDPAQARIRVVLASPGTVDELCGRAGLRTAGIYSCWNGRFAALNSWRWEVGADGFDDITTYRTYLVNHEFGHGLGYGHAGCPTAGAPAPVMMQQSKGLADCVANGWPYP